MKLKNIIKIGSFVVAGALPTTSNAQVYMCQACPAGTYSDGTQTQCTPCPAGTYSNGGASECKVCPAGKYSPAGSSECKDCATGTYSTGGAGSCSGCAQPTYSGWSSGSCGVTATRTKTTYCNASGNTSATANPSNSTESKYNGDCPKCKVTTGWGMCTMRNGSGQTRGENCGQQATTYYVDYGKTVKVGKKSCSREGYSCSIEYWQKVTLSDGSVCDTKYGYRTCTCR